MYFLCNRLYGSPGHAGKEGLHLAMTEASRVFSRAGEPVWDFSRGMSGSSGSLSCGVVITHLFLNLELVLIS